MRAQRRSAKTARGNLFTSSPVPRVAVLQQPLLEQIACCFTHQCGNFARDGSSPMTVATIEMSVSMVTAYSVAKTSVSVVTPLVRWSG